jgi:hypothetical protein
MVQVEIHPRDLKAVIDRLDKLISLMSEAWDVPRKPKVSVGSSVALVGATPAIENLQKNLDNEPDTDAYKR